MEVKYIASPFQSTESMIEERTVADPIKTNVADDVEIDQKGA